MLPGNNVIIFESILRDLHKNGILQDFILIGSWVLRVYKEHFYDNPQVPIVATQDLDLMLTNPMKVSRKVDVPSILEKYDLEEVRSPNGDNAKFVSPDFEVGFLYPMKGRGKRGGKIIKELGIIAKPLV